MKVLKKCSLFLLVNFSCLLCVIKPVLSVAQDVQVPSTPKMLFRSKSDSLKIGVAVTTRRLVELILPVF